VPRSLVPAERSLIEPPGVRVLLLDVEGTTTAVSFVYDVLFPYARSRLEPYLREHAGRAEVQADLPALAQERARERDPDAPPWSDASAEATLASAVAYATWLMDRDRKSTALKSLQGRIWEGGFRAGALRAHVYPDVPPALARWRGQGRASAIFSSGSVLAQRLLFAHTSAGDLTPLIAGYFDTTTGPKREGRSYARIAEALGAAPASVLFVSDVAEELDAAREAGLTTALCVREGAAPPPASHAVVRTFDDLYA
jgi:enolase-phosphatase E1